MRVLLDEHSGSSEKVWKLHASHGFLCSDMHRSEAKTVFNADTLEIVCKRGHVLCNGKRCLTNQLKINPVADVLACDGHTYQGSLLIVKKHDTVYLINELDIEDYLFGVLRWESWPGWPIEVNKAFAIASRSYVVARIVQAHKKKIPFHIRRTNIHQTYKGSHELVYLREAVDQTRGMILTHNNKPIDAMFDVCCGGIIPAYMHGVDFEKAPYLARSYACSFCKSCKSYSYSHQFSLKELEPLILKEVPQIKNLKELKVIKRDKAGVVQEVFARGAGGSSVLTGKQFYSLLDKIKSFCFSVYKKGQQFIVDGKGFGHHLGICQWGARAMVEQGRHYLHVLQFYYPGAVMKQLNCKREA